MDAHNRQQPPDETGGHLMRARRSGDRSRIGKDVAAPRPVDAATMASVSPLPPPDEIFADWLMSVPHHDVLEAAARCQIDIIDRSPVAAHPDVRTLRNLLCAMAGDCAWHKPIPNL